MPALTGPRHVLPALSDHMPGLASFAGLAGCRFAPRCPVKDPACANTRLPPRQVGVGHWVRCAEACGRADIAAAATALAASARMGARINKPRVVDFENVRLSYHAARGFLGLRRSRFDAVKSATFKVREGEILGIVGESGSGKTSVGRLIVGLERPSAGTIRINGDERTLQRRSSDAARHPAHFPGPAIGAQSATERAASADPGAGSGRQLQARKRAAAGGGIAAARHRAAVRIASTAFPRNCPAVSASA